MARTPQIGPAGGTVSKDSKSIQLWTCSAPWNHLQVGRVKVVLSKRHEDRNVVALFITDLRLSITKVDGHCLKRCAIEVMTKEHKASKL